MPKKTIVLCVGTDPKLLESRELVLQSAGFEASCHLPHEAVELLSADHFDILIISVNVGKEQRATLAAAAPERTRVIQLNGFVAPEELLSLIKA